MQSRKPGNARVLVFKYAEFRPESGLTLVGVGGSV